MAEHSSYPGVQPGQVFYCQGERDQLVARCNPSFPGYACVAYAVVVHKSYKGTVDYAVAPQIMAATNAIRPAWKFTVFIVSKPKGMGLTVTERMRKESDWLLVAAMQGAADAASTFVVCCVCEPVQ